jgi:hypothetical protein
LCCIEDFEYTIDGEQNTEIVLILKSRQKEAIEIEIEYKASRLNFAKILILMKTKSKKNVTIQ